MTTSLFDAVDYLRADPDQDDRATTPEVFGPLMERFRFTIDVCASSANTKCERFYTAEQNGLARSWAGERVWCNPPYSDLRPWVQKAWDESAATVMLIPANRTEQPFWQELVEPHRDHYQTRLRVEFLPKRIRFLSPGQTQQTGTPPFGCCLLIWAAS